MNPILSARLDWPSAIGNFILNYGALDWHVFVFLESRTPPKRSGMKTIPARALAKNLRLFPHSRFMQASCNWPLRSATPRGTHVGLRGSRRNTELGLQSPLANKLGYTLTPLNGGG